MSTGLRDNQSLRLLRSVTCPHCWQAFAPEDILWIAAHSDLTGDVRLGNEKLQRFLPTRFDTDGNAIDAMGFQCTNLACPNCHLGVPRAFLEMNPLFLSIFGSPGCGKSYFLAAMIWRLRRLLPTFFKLRFTDADPTANQLLHQYEESLFSNRAPTESVPLANLIQKTEEQGDFYDSVSFGNQAVSYPRPFMFVVQPQEGHRRFERSKKLGRVICLYDNAGESFQPGKDRPDNPVTRHMAIAQSLLFLFDPTQDTQFRQFLGKNAPVAQGTPVRMQDSVLNEAADRIRKLNGLAQGQRHDKPLIVVLTKADLWAHLLPDERILPAIGQVQRDGEPFGLFDEQGVQTQSDILRNLLQRMCPQIISAAENFSSDVTYVPSSATGQEVSVDSGTGEMSIRPADAKPIGIETPFLFILSRLLNGSVATVQRKTGRP